MPLTKEQIEQLQKTVRGRLSITFNQLREVHDECLERNKKLLVMSDREFQQYAASLDARTGSAMREALLGMTEALFDMLPRVERVEAFLEEVSKEPLPSAPPHPRKPGQSKGAH